MANIEKATETNRQTVGETTAPKNPLTCGTLSKMIASGKSVFSKASTK